MMRDLCGAEETQGSNRKLWMGQRRSQGVLNITEQMMFDLDAES